MTDAQKNIKQALVLDDKDNVATALCTLDEGSCVDILFSKGNHIELTVKQEVKRGFKISIKDVKKGEDIYKYGKSIGVATKDIEKGEVVHTQNLASKVQ